VSPDALRRCALALVALGLAASLAPAAFAGEPEPGLTHLWDEYPLEPVGPPQPAPPEPPAVTQPPQPAPPPPEPPAVTQPTDTGVAGVVFPDTPDGSSSPGDSSIPLSVLIGAVALAAVLFAVAALPSSATPERRLAVALVEYRFHITVAALGVLVGAALATLLR
jgi:hypothetical protein